MPINQDKRIIAIKTPLGKDVLGLRSFSVQEQMSRLFQIEADLSGEKDQTIDLDKVVGHEVTISLELRTGGDKRYFHGIVSRMVQTANENDYCHYHLTIVPWLWFLTRTSDCRVWEAKEGPSGKTVPEIIKAVFDLHEFSDYKLNLVRTYSNREFCVQYRETDFNFVSRLMEQEGIYYFFEHQDGKHTLVLVDDLNSHQPLPNKVIPFNPAKSGIAVPYAITDWTMEKEVQPVATALKDFNFQTSNINLLAKSITEIRKYGGAKYEIYDYPGEYDTRDDGTHYSDMRLDELQTQYETLHGQATARSLAPGRTFTLNRHPRNDQARDYLITGISLRADAGEFASTGDKSGSDVFSCNFACISFTSTDGKKEQRQFRPARLTPKPIIQGPQTAIVVGTPGDEIYTDKYGRVKVQFHWDRYGKKDQHSSCWVRVSQYWAGKEWGSIHIPRVGQEVIVEFLEGDPDRPIITGRVYNDDQTPPYQLPANKTQSGIKSRSTLGGGSANFNEIRFEDKKGSEQLLIHAEKDQTIEVEHDESHSVGNDRTKTIEHDETTNVKHDRTETVGNDEAITINGNRTETVQKDESISINGGRTETVAKDENITINGGRTEEVAKDESITINGGRTETVAKDESITISGGRTVEVSKDDKQSIGQKYELVAGDEIVLKTGDASIVMKSDGTIQIKGNNIAIEGSGDVEVKASGNLTLKGTKIAAN